MADARTTDEVLLFRCLLENFLAEGNRAEYSESVYPLAALSIAA